MKSRTENITPITEEEVKAEYSKLEEAVQKDAKSPKTSKKYIITVDNLALREGPGFDYDRIGLASAGLTEIVDIQNNFGRLADGSGWVCMDYTRKAN